MKGPTVRSVQNTYEKLNSNAELFLLLKYSSSIKKWSQVQQAKKKFVIVNTLITEFFITCCALITFEK